MKYNGKIEINIALPDFVNKNQQLSQRMLDNFMHDIQDLYSKYSFDSMAHTAELVSDESIIEEPIDEYIEYEPLDLNDIKPVLDYSNVTIKEIDDVVRECYGIEHTMPLAYNIAFNTLKLLDEDIENYIQVYQEEFPTELIERFAYIQLKIKDLMNDLK